MLSRISLYIFQTRVARFSDRCLSFRWRGRHSLVVYRFNKFRRFFHRLCRRGSRGGEMGEFSPPPPFSEPPSFFFFFFLSQDLVLLHYYKNSPPISKSWIRACSGELLLRSSHFLIPVVLTFPIWSGFSSYGSGKE